ncbi:AAA-ATPase At3g50940-like [Corylus avellana]|uniref:AAA-ATPase At3g50940-like n=1 Tax=Corylus avellana TaxID=13451 RepID=UPI00286D3829|nr:AAA-ATPase At3g50940-like [Corylus avellana]XP_059448008.1 AAA-ATPase At3g50940-like [Corylus avellana]
MFSLKSMPSITSVLSAYTTFAAVAMLVRTILNEFKTIASQLIPQKLQENFLSRLESLFGNLSSQMTLIIDEYSGLSINEIYQASELYLTTRITPSIRQLKVFKTPREKNLSITIGKGEKIVDTFEGIHLTWEFISTEKQKSNDSERKDSPATETAESRSILLSFSKQYKEKVLNTYLPHVVDRSKAIQEEKKVLRLYSMGLHFTWKYVHLEHPSTFETLAMDPKQKKELIDDLDRFVKRREFYRRVGKAWKRGYLLYGPPRTGKSSLIAAMANYLKFDIYDLELTNLRSNSELKRLLASTPNRSILVIENIDCSTVLQDRKHQERHHFFHGGSGQLTLSGWLNFIDGLWSSCGDERIIVFTTNHKDKLDPALLRAGSIDMHIHMSHCTPSGFKILASNYLGIESHSNFTEIEGLLKQVEVTPAEVAEELMKSDDVDIALTGLVSFLQRLNGLI